MTQLQLNLPLPAFLARKSADPADVLAEGAATFRERNSVYGDNYKLVAPIMQILFKDGLPKDIVFDDRWHLFELMVVKLTRFATSGLTHADSIHDTMVYAAMIEAALREKENGNG